ncbi:MAG TPA: hypothetical protein QF520_05555, partial [SAR202 cluster bacterium]|nr:hypothetical protein [SAR202 cluster bacterium]
MGAFHSDIRGESTKIDWSRPKTAPKGLPPCKLKSDGFDRNLFIQVFGSAFRKAREAVSRDEAIRVSERSPVGAVSIYLYELEVESTPLVLRDCSCWQSAETGQIVNRDFELISR